MFDVSNHRGLVRSLVASAKSIPDEEWDAVPEPYVPTPEALEFDRKCGDEHGPLFLPRRKRSKRVKRQP